MHKGFSTEIQSHPLGYHELKDKPAKLAAYCKFLVSICFLCIHCNIAVTIVSHHYFVGALQS